jgi:glycosyltransferase involved in cell wall biosynthesis
MPLVSVLMAVFNEEKFVGRAIESVLAQTFEDFELLLFDDGSTDGTRRVIEQFDDPRIRLQSGANRGQTACLAQGVEMAASPLVARLDADDIALPDRLKTQVSFSEHNPRYAMVGSQAIVLDERGNELCVCPVPTTNEEICDGMATRCCFLHSTVMFRREAVIEVGNYRPLFRFAQDYDLWLRLGERYPLANIAEPLVYRRLKARSPSVSRLHVQQRYAYWARQFASQRRQRGQDDLALGKSDEFERDMMRIGSLRGISYRRQLAENYFSWAQYCLWQGATGAYRHYLRLSLCAWPFQDKTWSHIITRSKGHVSRVARRLLPVR